MCFFRLKSPKEFLWEARGASQGREGWLGWGHGREGWLGIDSGKKRSLISLEQKSLKKSQISERSEEI